MMFNYLRNLKVNLLLNKKCNSEMGEIKVSRCVCNTTKENPYAGQRGEMASAENQMHGWMYIDHAIMQTCSSCHNPIPHSPNFSKPTFQKIISAANLSSILPAALIPVFRGKKDNRMN